MTVFSILARLSLKYFNERGEFFNSMKKLYVGNLPYDYDSAKLEALFAQYGAVESSVIIKDRDTGRSKGFGFVEIDNSGADAAIEALNNKDLNGRALRVNEARPMETNNNRQFRR